MSRTAHHVPRRGCATGEDVWPAQRVSTIFDLRYSANCRAQAAGQGRRPIPEPVRRKAAVYSFARSDLHDREISEWARVQERRARQRLRLEIRAVLQSLAFDTELTPARHRRDGIWMA
jgi:hypothetical protein